MINFIIGEHTWGLDNKLALKDYVSSQWTNKDLQKIKRI
jgi:hypothetical protein